jgi:hypothetical protein
MHGGPAARYTDSRTRGRSLGRLLAAVAGFLLLAAVGVNELLAGAGVIDDSSEPAGLRSVLLSFLWLAGAGVCAVLAVDFEHRLRGLPRGRVSREVAAARQGLAGALPGRQRSLSGRRYSPVSTLVAGLVFAALGVVTAFLAASAFGQAAQSSYTQSSGVIDEAVVVRVSNSQETSCGRSSCTTSRTAQVAATLSLPVDGQQATVISIPDNVSYSVGQPLAVLVDPREPGYAELPGRPYRTDGTAYGLTAGAALAFVVGAAAVIRAVRLLRRGYRPV